MPPPSSWAYKALLIWDIFDPSPLGLYRRLSRPVGGWLTRDEEAILFFLARAVPRDQCIVELGSWFGRSTILLGGGSARGNGTPVFAVDQFRAVGYGQELLEQQGGEAAKDFWERFHANIQAAGLQQKVTAIRSDTAELGSKWHGPPVGLLFLDADHSYEGVKRDWTNWRPHLALKAKAAFHDYQNPDYQVTPLVDELIAAGSLHSIEQHDSILLGEVADAAPTG